MELSMKKFTVRRFFSVYLRRKSRSKSSSLSRLEISKVICGRAALYCDFLPPDNQIFLPSSQGPGCIVESIDDEMVKYIQG